MVSLVLASGQSPLEISGGFIQNLSATANVFVSYTPNALGQDAVIPPGGSYTTKESVWVKTDGASCPITFNNDMSAVATSGTNIVAAVPGGIDVNIAGTDAGVSLPVTGTVNANITNAEIAVSGSIDVNNTIDIGTIAGGTVNIGQGNVKAFQQNTWTDMFPGGQGFNIPAGQGTVSIVTMQDCRTDQSLLFSFLNGNNPSSAAISGIIVDWYDVNGTYMYEEQILFWAGGSGLVILPVKGAYVSVTGFIDYTIYGNYPYSFFGVVCALSTLALPEEYYTGPPNGGNPNGTPLYFSNSGFSYNALQGGAQIGGHFMLDYQYSAAGAYGIFLLPTLSRMLHISHIYNTSGSGTNLDGEGVYVMAGVKGQAFGVSYGQWPNLGQITGSGTGSSTNQIADFQLPRAPIAIYIGKNGATTTHLYGRLSMVWERF